jgi:allantoate deiminase
VQHVPIDAALIEKYLDRMYEIGRLPGGGVWRPVYSAAWDEARREVRGWLAAAGLAVREDTVGNVFGRLDGRVPGPVLMVGSHVDSVYAGGKFDGPLGVIGAIAAVRALRESGHRPAAPIDVFVSCEEEDSRFICDFWGSRAILGTIKPDEAATIQDADGVAIGDAMRDFGLDPERIPEAARSDLAAFLELHIEQGPVLDREQINLGIVEAISGLNRTRVRLRGRADHAGTTPMTMRQDALAAAAEIVLAARRVANTMGEPARATIGNLTTRPNQPNIVAGEVDLIVDSRHPDREAQLRLLREIHELCTAIAQSSGVAIELDLLVDQPPTPMDPKILSEVEAAMQRGGWSYRRMVSGAGHDSQILGRRVPTAMIFVPSRDGRSHSPAEFTPLEQLLPGIQVLADTLRDLTA